MTFVIKTEGGKYLDKDGKLSEKEVKLTLADFTHEEGTDTYTLKIEGVDLGKYTVTETTKTIDGKDVTVTYKVNDGEATEGDEAGFAIENGKTTKVDFEDNYKNQTQPEKAKGNLEVTEIVKDDVAEENPPTFEIKTEDGKWLDENGKPHDQPVKLTLDDFDHEEGTDEYKLPIKDVEVGTYTITETTPDGESKDITVEVKEGETAEADFGKDKQKSGNFELTKTIKGDITEEEAEGTLKFEIKTEDGKWLDKDGKLSEQKVELTLKDFEHKDGTKEYTLKIEGVELGNYTVTETTKDVDGKDVKVSYRVNGADSMTGDKAEFTIKDGETTTVAFEDSYTKEGGTAVGPTKDKKDPKDKKKPVTQKDKKATANPSKGKGTATGDDTQLTLLLLLFLTSLTGIGGIAIANYRRKQTR